MTPWSPTQYEAIVGIHDGADTRLVRLVRAGASQVTASVAGTLDGLYFLQKLGSFIRAVDASTEEYSLLSFDIGGNPILTPPPTGFQHGAGAFNSYKEDLITGEAYLIRYDGGYPTPYNLNTDVITTVLDVPPSFLIIQQIWDGIAWCSGPFSNTYRLDLATGECIEVPSEEGESPFMSASAAQLVTLDPQGAADANLIWNAHNVQVYLYQYNGSSIGEGVLLQPGAVMSSALSANNSDQLYVARNFGAMFTYLNSGEEAVVTVINRALTEAVYSAPRSASLSRNECMPPVGSLPHWGRSDWFGVGSGFNAFATYFPLTLIDGNFAVTDLFDSLTNPSGDPLFADLATVNDENFPGVVFGAPAGTPPPPVFVPFWGSYNRTAETLL